MLEAGRQQGAKDLAGCRAFDVLSGEGCYLPGECYSGLVDLFPASQLLLHGPVLPLAHGVLVFRSPDGENLGGFRDKGTVPLGCHVQGGSYKRLDVLSGCFVATCHGTHQLLKSGKEPGIILQSADGPLFRFEGLSQSGCTNESGLCMFLYPLGSCRKLFLGGGSFAGRLATWTLSFGGCGVLPE